MRAVVFGATGTIGSALLPALARDFDVVAVSRSARSGDGSGVRWVVADALDGDAVRVAVDGADVVYYLVHSLGTDDFERRDRVAAQTIAAAAADAGVGRLVYLGGLGDDAPGLSPHLRSRLETGHELAAGAVPVTTLRAGMVIGAGSAAFETILALVDRLPVMVAPSWLSTPTQPIALDDVVRYLVGVATLPAAVGESFDIGGPEVMTYRQMVARIARTRNRHPLIIEVPVLTPRLSSWWLHLVTPVNAAVARPLIEGLRNPTVVRDDRIRELIPFEPMPFDEAVSAALASRAARPAT